MVTASAWKVLAQTSRDGSPSDSCGRSGSCPVVWDAQQGASRRAEQTSSTVLGLPLRAGDSGGCGVRGGSGKQRWGREVVEFRARFPHFPRRLEPGAAGRVLAAQARLGQPLEPESAQPRGPQELCGRRFAFSSPGAGTGGEPDSAHEGQSLGRQR